MMKTKLLEGKYLNYAVAKALGHKAKITYLGCEILDWNRPGTKVNGWHGRFLTDWSQTGRLISEEKLDINHNEDGTVTAGKWLGGKYHEVTEQDLQTAICRVIVLAYLGEEVDITE